MKSILHVVEVSLTIGALKGIAESQKEKGNNNYYNEDRASCSSSPPANISKSRGSR